MTSFRYSHAEKQLKTCQRSFCFEFLSIPAKTIKNKYLFFADVLVGLIFKPLLNASKRHVPVIFGNILTETEGRERGRKWGGGQRQEKWLFDPLCLLHPYNQLLGTNLVTCPFENYSFSMRCSPIKWLTLRHVSVTQLVIHRWLHSLPITHPSPTAQTPHLVFFDSLWASCLH